MRIKATVTMPKIPLATGDIYPPLVGGMSVGAILKFNKRSFYGRRSILQSFVVGHDRFSD